MACSQATKTKKLKPNEIKTNSFDNLENFSFTSSTSDDFIQAKKNYLNKIKFDSLKLNKINGEIKLPIDEKWKPFISFKDTLLNTDETDVREYKYFGEFENIGLYIIEANYWEHFEYYLINQKTGKQTVIWNYPYISPNNLYIANLSMPYGLEGVPNGIQIWKIDKNSYNNVDLIKYFEIDQQIWAAEDFVWESDNSIILKVVYLNENNQKTESQNLNSYSYLKLKI